METIPYGLILAGGKSTRLGRDKVVESIAGVRLLPRLLELARSVCGEVYVSGRDPSAQGIDAPWMEDDSPGQGPIGGIVTGLTRLQAPMLALACDLPLMDLATLRTLVTAWKIRPEQAVMTTFLQVETGFIEALVAVYEPSAAPLLQAAMDAGCHKLSRAIPEEKRRHIPYTRDMATPFFNINYPADMEQFKQLRQRCIAPEETI